MKRQFFAIPLLLIAFCFIFSTNSFAVTCGDDGTWTHCGPTAGCPEGFMCLPNGGISTKSNCDTPATNDCTGVTRCGDPGTVKNCDAAGGCPTGNVCNSDGSCTPGSCFNTTPTPELIDCTIEGGLFGCENQPCLIVDGVQTCGDGLYCSSGVCKKDLISDNTAYGPYCITGRKDSGIRTALGCIKISSDDASGDLIKIILQIATGVGGGIALALILYGVFIVTTSAGMPDKLKAGSEIITSAVIGLIFILLSIFLVNLIGINILGIPGLS